MGDAGAFLDLHETNRSRRFKLFGSLGYNAALLGGEDRAAGPAITTKLITAVSADGKRWSDFTNASSMQVAGDTANNVLYSEREETFPLWCYSRQSSIWRLLHRCGHAHVHCVLSSPL